MQGTEDNTVQYISVWGRASSCRLETVSYFILLWVYSWHFYHITQWVIIVARVGWTDHKEAVKSVSEAAPLAN